MPRFPVPNLHNFIPSQDYFNSSSLLEMYGLFQLIALESINLEIESIKSI